jgi:hypothetical protein
MAEESRLRRGCFQHLRHRTGDRQPFEHLPRLVDAHADQEDDEVALDSPRDAAGDDLGHAMAPLDNPQIVLNRNARYKLGHEKAWGVGASLATAWPK